MIPKRFLAADEVKAQIQRLLADCPDLREDDEALVLSLESETDATEFCTRLVRKIKENEAYSNGVAAYIAELRGRQEMFDRRDIGLRAILLKVMEAAGLKKLPLPIATLSATTSQHVNVIELLDIPSEYLRYKPPEPNKTEIKAALKAGKAVPGCVLSNPEPHLTIRIK
jgi:Siphovirus Gp157